MDIRVVELVDLKLFGNKLGIVLSFLLIQPKKQRDKLKLLLDGHLCVDWTNLWTIADDVVHILRISVILFDTFSLDLDVTLRNDLIRCKTLECSCLSSTVDT